MSCFYGCYLCGWKSTSCSDQKPSEQTDPGGGLRTELSWNLGFYSLDTRNQKQTHFIPSFAAKAAGSWCYRPTVTWFDAYKQVIAFFHSKEPDNFLPPRIGPSGGACCCSYTTWLRTERIDWKRPDRNGSNQLFSLSLVGWQWSKFNLRGPNGPQCVNQVSFVPPHEREPCWGDGSHLSAVLVSFKFGSRNFTGSLFIPLSDSSSVFFYPTGHFSVQRS